MADPFRSGWKRVATHTHMMRGELREPQSLSNLVAWADRFAVDAVGVGSPYTAKSLLLYQRYDGDMAPAYYSGLIDQKELRPTKEAEGLLDRLNALSEGRTLFYLDNETPKARYGHLWWFGWQHDFPPWHDYDQPFDRWMVNMQSPRRFVDEPMPYERRPYLDIIESQRARDGLGIWAHPTSWWYNAHGAFITNIASGLPTHLLAQGRIDGMAIMGNRTINRPYLRLWRHLLDRGYKITGVGEIDHGLSDATLPDNPVTTCLRVPQPDDNLDVATIVDSVRSGRVFTSTGPLVDLSADGVQMGGETATAKDRRHVVTLVVWAGDNKRVGSIRLTGRGGIELWAADDVDPGVYEIELLGDGAHQALVAAISGEGERLDLDGIDALEQVAVSNPVYLCPSGSCVPAPLSTELQLDIDSWSPWREGHLHVSSSVGGFELDVPHLRGEVREVVPADSTITLETPEGVRAVGRLVDLHPGIRRLQRYLYRGRFLDDYPDAKPGDVPPAAFGLDATAHALGRTVLSADVLGHPGDGLRYCRPSPPVGGGFP